MQGAPTHLQSASNLPLQEHGPPLVQPEVFPAGICHKIACPAVGNLVSNHIGQTSVTGQKGGGHKCETWVLHTTVGETRGEQQQVIPAPHIGPCNSLAWWEQCDIESGVSNGALNGSEIVLLLGLAQITLSNASSSSADSDDTHPGDQSLAQS